VEWAPAPLHSANANLFLFTSLSSCFTSSYMHHLISHHLHSRHLSLPVPWRFTPDFKVTCFTNPFLHHNLSGSIWTAFTDLGLRPETKWVVFIFCFRPIFFVSGYVCPHFSVYVKLLSVLSCRHFRQDRNEVNVNLYVIAY